MGFTSTIKMTIRNLLARKGRSFLTMLGIIIGVAGVIIIISMGAGAQSLVLGQVNKLGSNLLSIQPGKSDPKGPPAQVYGVVVTTLVNQDADALRSTSQVPHAYAVNALVLGSGAITWQNKSVDSRFVGTDSGYANVTNFSMAKGQYLSSSDADGGANVVVLGSKVSDELFGGTGVDPVGQVIKVRSASQQKAGGVPLRVVGVMASRGTVFFQDMDNMVIMPLNIAQGQLLGIHHVQEINIKVDKAENIDQTISDVTNTLKQRHHIISDDDIDFTVRNQATAADLLKTITSALSLFLTSMAAIALFVGGIGILNIMLVTVAERTREIGLRKAVGATNAMIMRQFILEASILTLLGGIVGIIVGAIVSFGMAMLMKYLGYDWDFVISITSVVLAVGVSVLTGVVFGIYPSYKASKLNPIEALRYE